MHLLRSSAKAGIHNRYHKLGPGLYGDFRVHIFRANGKVWALGDQIANILKEGFVFEGKSSLLLWCQ